MDTLYDLAIIGGGINGCGIARDAAGRGFSVYLCEQADLASGTSSTSTKLIHGGLRYLERYEFRLVREALSEREVLLRIAPHIIWPLHFVLPHHKGLRPRWLLRLGLLIYDNLGARKLLPPARTLDLSKGPVGASLKPGLYTRGFEYSDCWADDARLVTLNAVDAAERGAIVRTRVKALEARRGADDWTLTTQNLRTGQTEVVRAKALVNAAGPWVGAVLSTMRLPHASGVRLVKGSHIVVPRLYAHDRCYLFQNADGRVIFAIPYEDDFTLIGTTDLDYTGSPTEVTASQEEVEYLCAAANEYFRREITREDVVWTYSGVRSLYDDGADKAQAATRDYVLELDDKGPPLLSIFGGKLTTYRRLAEHALEKLTPWLGASATIAQSWSGRVPLPGGEFPVEGFEVLVASLARRFDWLDAAQARRLARAYGMRATRILRSMEDDPELRADFGGGLTKAEVLYLMREEWAEDADDVLWRRSKLGLRLSSRQREQLADFMDQAGPLAETMATADAGER